MFSRTNANRNSRAVASLFSVLSFSPVGSIKTEYIRMQLPRREDCTRPKSWWKQFGKTLSSGGKINLPERFATYSLKHEFCAGTGM